MSAIFNYKFHCTPGLFLFTLLNQRRHLFVFFISDFLIVFTIIFTFHFYKDGQVLLRETTHIKKKQFLRWILWLGLVLYFIKSNFDHSCILLFTSESQILMSILGRTIYIQILKLFVKSVSQSQWNNKFMKSWMYKFNSKFSEEYNTLSWFYETRSEKNILQEWCRIFSLKPKSRNDKCYLKWFSLKSQNQPLLSRQDQWEFSVM